MTPKINVADIPMPSRIAVLRRDPTRPQFAVPWFVWWDENGIPDFRVIGEGKINLAHKANLCWLCGQKLGAHKAFVIGPMCAINRVSSEPPSHRDCAEYATKVCPFLTQPKMRRNEKGTEQFTEAAGVGLKRNPGASLIWITRAYKTFRIRQGDGNGAAQAGILFDVGEPDEVLWYAQGRIATREEVIESITSGLPSLRQIAEEEGPESLAELSRRYDAAMLLLPPAAETEKYTK